MTGPAPIPYVTTPLARFGFFCAFLLLVFLLGGSSRDDVPSLVALRPIAILFAGYALAIVSREQLRALGLPFVLLLALGALMLIQLIPLPPMLWTALPGREVPIAIAEAMGIAQPWRPLSLSPTKTWNSLFSLSVPIAAMLLAAVQDAAYRRHIWTAIVVIAVISALWAVLQLSGPPNGLLYLYKNTNNGWAVGLFANRNHQGVFLATTVLAISYCFAHLSSRAPRSGLYAALLASAALLILPMILLAGSRAGLFVGGLALLGSLWVLANAPYLPERMVLSRTRSLSRRAMAALVGGLMALPIILIIVFSRAIALDRLVSEDNAEGLRYELLPLFGQMIADFFPFGAGFGSFEYVYKVYEQVDALNPRYLNLAHNDWAQWGIEAGLPGMILLGVFIFWFGRSLLRAATVSASEDRTGRLVALMMLIGFAIGSAFDYPLRVPAAMAIFALLCVLVQLRPPATSVPEPKQPVS